MFTVFNSHYFLEHTFQLVSALKIAKSYLSQAAAKGIITREQADELFNFFSAQPNTGPSFDFTHLLYYLGGLIAIGAMSLFMSLGWESFGGWGIFFISLLYAGVGLALSNRFQNKGYAVPAGICATFAVVLTPLAIYGLQQALGLWPDDTDFNEYHRKIKWHWVYMEFGTLAIATIVARIYKYPFLIMPIAVTLWYMTMDMAVMITGERPEMEVRSMVSMYSGLLMIGLAFWVDMRSRQTADYAFWLYIFGVIAFWGGMTSQHSDSELSKFIYFSINLLMLGTGVLLVRRIFVVFGALGCVIYLGHLAFKVFEDSWLFPIALSALGLGIVYLGVLWQKNEGPITVKVRGWLPIPLQEMLQKNKL